MVNPRPRVSSQKKENRRHAANNTSQSVMGYLFQSQEAKGQHSPQQSSCYTSSSGGFSSLDLMPVPISSTNVVVSNHPVSTQGPNDLDQEIAALFAEDGHRNNTAPTRASATIPHFSAATAMGVPASINVQLGAHSHNGTGVNEVSGFETSNLHLQPVSTMPPEAFFKQMLHSRGYSTKTYSSRECGYSTKPTELQVASYGTAVVKAIHSQNIGKLYSLLTCGLSRNPCNVFSDGTLCMSIRRGCYELFKCQLDAGASVQVADDFGRTPLHFCAWSAKPCFKTVEKILDRDINMLRVTDNRGKTPLEYLMPKQQYAWMEFLEKKKDVYWPNRGEDRKEAEKIPVVVRAGKTNPKTIPDPENALNPVYATMISYGVKSIQEVMELIQEEKNKTATETKKISTNASPSTQFSKMGRKPTGKPRSITPAPPDHQKAPSTKKIQGASVKLPAAPKKTTKNKRKMVKDISSKAGRKIRKVPSIIEARQNTLASRTA